MLNNAQRYTNMAKVLGFYRAKHILGDLKANPPIEPIIPVCRTTWHNGVKSGKYPQPVKIGGRMVAWRVEDIDTLVKQLCNGTAVI